jgi:hypothetical protein
MAAINEVPFFSIKNGRAIVNFKGVPKVFQKEVFTDKYNKIINKITS